MYPIYIFGSGTVQIGHFLLIIFSRVVLIKIGMPKDKYFYTFLIFLIYCYSINIFYFAYDLYIFKDPYRYVFIPPDLTYLRDILFITFNFVLVISIISYLNYQKKLNIIFYGVLTAILIILFPIIYKFLSGLPFTVIWVFLITQISWDITLYVVFLSYTYFIEILIYHII